MNGQQLSDNQDADAPNEPWRELGQAIDENTIRRVAEALREHELRYHPAASAANDERERIPDETLRSILREIQQRDCSHAEVAERHGVSYARYVVDLADFESRMRREVLLQQADDEVDELFSWAFTAEGEVAS